MDLKIDGLSLCGGGQRTDRHVGDMPSACATYQARRESAALENTKREVGLIEDLPRDEPKVIVL